MNLFDGPCGSPGLRNFAARHSSVDVEAGTRHRCHCRLDRKKKKHRTRTTHSSAMAQKKNVTHIAFTFHSFPPPKNKYGTRR
jgi:hypothetical protein